MWDRKLQTDRLEYLDRDDVPAKKRSVVESLDLLGEKKGLHRWNAEQAAGFLVGIDSRGCSSSAPPTVGCLVNC